MVEVKDEFDTLNDILVTQLNYVNEDLKSQVQINTKKSKLIPNEKQIREEKNKHAMASFDQEGGK